MVIKKYCLFIWKMMDIVYFNLTRLQYIKNNDGKNTIMRVRQVIYKGRNVVLSDGTKINKNDVLIKIHLHNVKLLSQLHLSNDVRKGLILYRSIHESLPYICRYLQLHQNTTEIKGLIGITMLYRGCKRLGFEPVSIQNRYYKLFKRVALYPIYFLSSNNVSTKRIPEPMYLFMSKKHLLDKYKYN